MQCNLSQKVRIYKYEIKGTHSLKNSLTIEAMSDSRSE